MNNRKVVAIGIDGGEFGVFDRMIKRGLMPNLESIMKKSASHSIDTYVQGPGQGWASFITGKSPAKHGVYYWTLYKKMVNSRFIKDKYLWEILGEKGIRSCVINMSYTHPPRPMDGHMIAGLGSGLSASDTSLKLTYPENLMAEIRKEVGEYIPACDYKDGSIEDHLQLLRKMIRMTQARTKTCLYLMDTYSPDFVLPVYRGADLIQHCYWNFLEPDFTVTEQYKPLKDMIENYYSELDKSIGALWRKYDKSVNFIVSDHGFGPVKAIVHLNYYLAERGFLARAAEHHGAMAEKANFARDIVKKMYHKTLKKYGIFKRLNKLRKSLQGVDLPIDMSRTVAYCDAFSGITINKRSSAIKDMNKTKEDLVRSLKELKDPVTNERVVEKVYFKEDCFAKDSSDAPDIIFEAKESYLVSYLMPKNDDRVFRYMNKEEAAFFTGSHRKKGMLVLDGNGLAIAKDVKDINITDVSATIIGLLGVKPPADLDGRMLYSIPVK